MKKRYEEPKIAILNFENVDVLTASAEDIGEWDG